MTESCEKDVQVTEEPIRLTLRGDAVEVSHRMSNPIDVPVDAFLEMADKVRESRRLESVAGLNNCCCGGEPEIIQCDSGPAVRCAHCGGVTSRDHWNELNDIRTASGKDLDAFAMGLGRWPGETDAALRERLKTFRGGP